MEIKKYLSDKYACVYCHKGFDICTLKSSVPTEDDELGYLIDSEQFKGKVYEDIAGATAAIDSMARNTAKHKYLREKGKRVNLEFYGTESDIIAFLETKERKQPYIKALIRKDMSKQITLDELLPCVPKAIEHCCIVNPEGKEHTYKISDVPETEGNHIVKHFCFAENDTVIKVYVN